MVVHDGADDVCQQAAAFVADSVEGEEDGRGGMQPARLAGDAKASLVNDTNIG